MALPIGPLKTKTRERERGYKCIIDKLADIEVEN
jgi:hypothetical protein